MDYKKNEKVVLVWCLTVNVFYTIEKVHFAYKNGMISVKYNNKRIYFKDNILVDREENKITGHLDIKCYKYSKELIKKVQKEHNTISKLNKVNEYCDMDIEMLINSKIKMISNLKYSRLVNRKGMRL